MSSEHVEVLRRMRNEWPLATDEGPALDAAIASLSAQQPASDGGFTAADMMDARQEGRKEAQQPAAVDEAMVERACKAAVTQCSPNEVWPNDYSEADDLRAMMQAALTAALAAQQPAAVDGSWDELRIIVEEYFDDPHADAEYVLHKIAVLAAKQTAAVDGAAVERVAALLHNEATDEPWTVAGVEHDGPDREYYRKLARKAVALAAQQGGVK